MDPIRLLLYSCPASREIFNGMLLRINSHQLLAWCWCHQKRQKWEMPWYPSDWLTDWLVWQNFRKDLAKHILPIVFSKFFFWEIFSARPFLSKLWALFHRVFSSALKTVAFRCSWFDTISLVGFAFHRFKQESSVAQGPTGRWDKDRGGDMFSDRLLVLFVQIECNLWFNSEMFGAKRNTQGPHDCSRIRAPDRKMGKS